jgi:hypothetical protein
MFEVALHDFTDHARKLIVDRVDIARGQCVAPIRSAMRSGADNTIRRAAHGRHWQFMTRSLIIH